MMSYVVPTKSGDERADSRLPTFERRLDVLIRGSRGAPDGPVRRLGPAAGRAGHVLPPQRSDPAGPEPDTQLLVRFEKLSSRRNRHINPSL